MGNYLLPCLTSLFPTLLEPEVLGPKSQSQVTWELLIFLQVSRIYLFRLLFAPGPLIYHFCLEALSTVQAVYLDVRRGCLEGAPGLRRAASEEGEGTMGRERGEKPGVFACTFSCGLNVFNHM